MLIEVKQNKYQTNIIIFTEVYQKEVREKAVAMSGVLGKEYLELPTTQETIAILGVTAS